jgi:hypothetical protein
MSISLFEGYGMALPYVRIAGINLRVLPIPIPVEAASPSFAPHLLVGLFGQTDAITAGLSTIPYRKSAPIPLPDKL